MSEDDARDLRAWLGESDEHVDAFVRDCDLHWQLHEAMGREALREQAVGDLDTPIVGRVGTATRWLRLAIAAAVALASVLTLALMTPSTDNTPDAPSALNDEAVATIVAQSAAQWGGGVSRLSLGDQLDAVPATLDAGVAEMLFANGAAVRVHGPSSFRLTGPQSVHIERGAAIVRIAEQARGFTVTTPTARVVDLGTAFAVRVGDDGRTDVFVLEGEVEVSADRVPATRVGSGAGVALTAGADELMIAASPSDNQLGGLFEKHVALAAGGFETTLGRIQVGRVSQPGLWGGDEAHVVGAEQGIVPIEGDRMLRFAAASRLPEIGEKSDLAGSNVAVIVDVSSWRDAIASGRATAVLSAAFNRVTRNAQTDRKFGVGLSCFDANGRRIAERPQRSIITDADTDSWERVGVSLRLPAGTTRVAVNLTANEDVHNDPHGSEFHGHYADDVRLEILTEHDPVFQND